MRIIILIGILFFLALAMVGQNIYEQDYNNFEKRDIVNYTNTIINISEEVEFERMNITNSSDYSEVITTRIINIMFNWLDYAVYTIQEVSKTSIELGYNYPEIDYYKIITFVKWVAIIMVGAFFVPFLVGLLFVLTLIGYGLYLGIKLVNHKIIRTKTKKPIK